MLTVGRNRLSAVMFDPHSQRLTCSRARSQFQ
jgi:hypothetical protein